MLPITIGFLLPELPIGTQHHITKVLHNLLKNINNKSYANNKFKDDERDDSCT